MNLIFILLKATFIFIFLLELGENLDKKDPHARWNLQDIVISIAILTWGCAKKILRWDRTLGFMLCWFFSKLIILLSSPFLASKHLIPPAYILFVFCSIVFNSNTDYYIIYQIFLFLCHLIPFFFHP